MIGVEQAVQLTATPFRAQGQPHLQRRRQPMQDNH